MCGKNPPRMPVAADHIGRMAARRLSAAKYLVVLSLAGLAFGWVGEQQTDYVGQGPRRYGAICADGWRSNATGSGACSWHGGVSRWLTTESTAREIRSTWAARNQDILASGGKVGLLLAATLAFLGTRLGTRAKGSATPTRHRPPVPRHPASRESRNRDETRGRSSADFPPPEHDVQLELDIGNTTEDKNAPG